MVSSNPLFRGGWSLRKFNSTVINDIWPEVMFFSAVGAMVACLQQLTDRNPSIPSDLLGVLGTVLGLVISFRTSSAYERYTEGRKLWTQIAINSRNVAEIIWVFVPLERTENPATGQRGQTKLQSVIEKKSMINLVQAFSVGLKHFLRSEPGIYYEDLYPLLSFLPRYGSANPSAHGDDDVLPLWHASEEDSCKLDHSTSYHEARPAPVTNHTQATLVGSQSEKSMKNSYPSLSKKKNRAALNDPEMGYLPSVYVHRPLRPARNEPEYGLLDYLPFLRFFRWLGGGVVNRAQDAAAFVGVAGRSSLGKKRKIPLQDSNVPVEICMYLLSYANYLNSAGLLPAPMFASLTTNIGVMQDTLSNLERIRSTPLPFAYQAHLRMSLWLYLFFLPFQIVAKFEWLVIPGTAFASFLLLGFLEIGQEIEDPFGYDHNDLDLDGFCLAIQRELTEITVHDAPHPLDYMFTVWNQPFAPSDRRSALELVQNADDYAHTHAGVEPGMDSIKRTLLKSWKDVEHRTRNVRY